MLLTSSQGHVSPLVLQQRARAYKFVIQNSLIAATELEVQWGEFS